MNRITKLLIAASLLIAGTAVAQQECAIICHNGTLVKAIGGSAINGHLNHHNDILISTDCNYEIIGNECESLSLPKLDLKKQIPPGLDYYITDLWGRIYRVGKTDGNFKNSLPKGGVYFIRVKGYQTLKRLF